MIEKFILFSLLSNILVSDLNAEPLKWINKPSDFYRGYIYTDSNVAIVNPVLQVQLENGEEICNFILKGDQKGDFRVIVESAHLGIGKIVRTRIRTDDSTKSVKLTVLGEACHNPGLWSEPATVSIKMIKPPVPVWSQSFYKVNISTSTLPETTVTKVVASASRDLDPDNRICGYKIQEPRDSIFDINFNGLITLQRPIKYNDDISETGCITLLVSAEDCSQPNHHQSEVNVFVCLHSSVQCHLKWNGFHSTINYSTPNPNRIRLIGKSIQFASCDSNMEVRQLFEVCEKNGSLKMTTSIDLEIHHNDATKLEDGVSCAFDHTSLQLQREICDVTGYRNQSIPLLHTMSNNLEIKDYPLNADDSVPLPVATIDTPDRLTLFFWIRLRGDKMRGKKAQTIYTEINDHQKQILSLRMTDKCHMEVNVVLPQRYESVKVNVSQYSIVTMAHDATKICDDKWHLVMLLLNRYTSHEIFNQNLKLFIDGNPILGQMVSALPNVDDTTTNPLDKRRSDLFIGQSPLEIDEDLQGYVAGTVLIPQEIVEQPIAASHCLSRCVERLHFSGLNKMSPGMSVSLNSEMRTIIINGHHSNEVAKLLNLIGYAPYPSYHSPSDPLKRLVKVQTDILCHQHKFIVPDQLVRIIIPAMSPVIHRDRKVTGRITLHSSVTRLLIPDPQQIRPGIGTGLPVFGNVSFNGWSVDHADDIPTSTNEISESRYEPFLLLDNQISRCQISIRPPLISTMEYLDWPRETLQSIRSKSSYIDVTNTSDKLLLSGPHNCKLYEFIIQNIKYYSSVVHHYQLPYSNRRFQLHCTQIMADLNTATAIDEEFTFSKHYITNKIDIKVITWYSNSHHGTKPSNKNMVSNIVPPDSKHQSNKTYHKSHDTIGVHAKSGAATFMDRDRNVAQPFSDKKVKAAKSHHVLLVLGICMVVVVIIVVLSLVTQKWKSSSSQCNTNGNHWILTSFLADKTNQYLSWLPCLHWLPTHFNSKKQMSNYYIPQSLRKPGRRSCCCCYSNYRSNVKVELSRDFLARTSYLNHKRRNIGLEMQWDDDDYICHGDLSSLVIGGKGSLSDNITSRNSHQNLCNVISNPLYENQTGGHCDDEFTNLPPHCESEDYEDYECDEDNSAYFDEEFAKVDHNMLR